MRTPITLNPAGVIRSLNPTCQQLVCSARLVFDAFVQIILSKFLQMTHIKYLCLHVYTKTEYKRNLETCVQYNFIHWQKINTTTFEDVIILLCFVYIETSELNQLQRDKLR